jgi:hypothetical protein
VVIDPILERVIQIADEAALQTRDQRRVRYALAGIVDLVVEHRRLAAVVAFDPVVAALVQSHRAQASFEQIQALFTGPDPDAERLVGAAVVSGGLMMAGIDPALAGLSDDDLRRLLVASARRLLRQGLPPLGMTIRRAPSYRRDDKKVPFLLLQGGQLLKIWTSLRPAPRPLACVTRMRTSWAVTGVKVTLLKFGAGVDGDFVCPDMSTQVEPLNIWTL